MSRAFSPDDVKADGSGVVFTVPHNASEDQRKAAQEAAIALSEDRRAVVVLAPESAVAASSALIGLLAYAQSFSGSIADYLRTTRIENGVLDLSRYASDMRKA